MESVQVSASFYEEDGAFIGTASGFTEPSSIPPGGKAGFEFLITSDTVQDDTERYEFSIQWRDDDFDEHTIRITGEQGEEDNNDDDDSPPSVNEYIDELDLMNSNNLLEFNLFNTKNR